MGGRKERTVRFAFVEVKQQMACSCAEENAHPNHKVIDQQSSFRRRYVSNMNLLKWKSRASQTKIIVNVELFSPHSSNFSGHTLPTGQDYNVGASNALYVRCWEELDKQGERHSFSIISAVTIQ